MLDKLHKKEMIVFDVDGVILDSQKIYIEAARYMCEEISRQTGTDYTQTEDQYKAHAADFHSPRKIFKQGDIVNEELVKEAYKLFKEFTNEETHPERFPLVNGVETVLNEVRKKFILAFFSSKSKIGLDGAINHHNLGEIIHHSLSRDCVEETKPSPIGLYILMNKFNLEASQILMIGDSQFDHDAAVAANVDFIGVNSGVYEAQDWDKIGAYHIESIKELINI